MLEAAGSSLAFSHALLRRAAPCTGRALTAPSGCERAFRQRSGSAPGPGSHPLPHDPRTPPPLTVSRAHPLAWRSSQQRWRCRARRAHPGRPAPPPPPLEQPRLACAPLTGRSRGCLAAGAAGRVCCGYGWHTRKRPPARTRTRRPITTRLVLLRAAQGACTPHARSGLAPPSLGPPGGCLPSTPVFRSLRPRSALAPPSAWPAWRAPAFDAQPRGRRLPKPALHPPPTGPLLPHPPLLQILGVSYTASTDEIKRAYRRLAKEYHPDISADDEATEFAMFLNDVYEARAREGEGGCLLAGAAAWRREGGGLLRGRREAACTAAAAAAAAAREAGQALPGAAQGVRKTEQASH